jgi:predicted TIM-barrel fold metal-dependent hydrolase
VRWQLLVGLAVTASLSVQAQPRHPQPVSERVVQSLDTGVPLAPRVDHHQHLVSPAIAKLLSPPTPLFADRLIEQLDAAGIGRAVVLSMAYMWGSAWIDRPADEYGAVRAENDWTAQQTALYPNRLIGVCSVNPPG